MEFNQVVRARHSFRGFLPQQVDKETLEAVFETRNWAPPTAMCSLGTCMFYPAQPVIVCVRKWWLEPQLIRRAIQISLAGQVYR